MGPAGAVALAGVAELVVDCVTLGLMVVGPPFLIQTPLPCWQRIVFPSSQRQDYPDMP